MRVAFIVVLLIGAFSASQAVDFSFLTDSLKEVGKNLVNGLVETGKKALADLASKFLPGLIGKRDMHGFFTDAATKLAALLDHGKKIASGVFSKTMDKLKGLVQKFHEKIGMVKDAKEVNDKIDDVVDKHDVMQKRILGSILEKGTEIFKGLAGHVSNLWGKAKDLAGKVVEHGKNLLTAAKGKLSEVVSGLAQKAADLGVNTGLIGKRAVLSLSDHLKNIGNTLSTIVSPFKDIVKGLGTTLKGHFSNLVDTVKGHAAALGDKLKGHVSDLASHGSKLLEHGKNALGAISEVVSDVLKQTLDNAKPHIDGVAKTLAGAGQTALNHLTGADKQN